MKLEIGKDYKFKNGYEWFTLRIMSVGVTSYKAEVINAYIDSSKEIGHRFSLAKDSILFNKYQVMDVTVKEPDHIINTPLIDLYIEMALQTNDREWFMELTEMKKGVVA